MIDTNLLKVLACPSCHGSLDPEGGPEQLEGLCCAKCSVVYPVQNDIPVMLKEEAISLVEWKNGKRKK